jgi:hypothetical protein
LKFSKGWLDKFIKRHPDLLSKPYGRIGMDLDEDSYPIAKNITSGKTNVSAPSNHHNDITPSDRNNQIRESKERSEKRESKTR